MILEQNWKFSLEQVYHIPWRPGKHVTVQGEMELFSTIHQIKSVFSWIYLYGILQKVCVE